MSASDRLAQYSNAARGNGLKDFDGKTIVLTGAASGIGLECSKVLAARGAKVSMADLQEGPLREAAEGIEKDGGKVLYSVVDVRDSKSIDAWLDRTVKEFGKLDGACNLAGVIGRNINVHRIWELSDEEYG